jgi:hypothetical protein
MEVPAGRLWGYGFMEISDAYNSMDKSVYSTLKIAIFAG